MTDAVNWLVTQLLPKGCVVTYTKGKHLQYAGDPQEHCYYVLSGHVSAVLAEASKAVLAYQFGQKDVIGAAGLAKADATCNYDLVAASDAKVVRVSLKLYWLWLSSLPESDKLLARQAALDLLLLISQKEAAALRVMAFRSICERLVDALYVLADARGVWAEDVVTVKVTNTEMAAMIGCSREHLSRDTVAEEAKEKFGIQRIGKTYRLPVRDGVKSGQQERAA
jgi:CRP-like cAMP-binding protein